MQCNEVGLRQDQRDDVIQVQVTIVLQLNSKQCFPCSPTSNYSPMTQRIRFRQSRNLLVQTVASQSSSDHWDQAVLALDKTEMNFFLKNLETKYDHGITFSVVLPCNNTYIA